MSAFGFNFVLVNDVQQMLDPKIVGPGWVHLATVKRGLKEYCAFKHVNHRDTYIEEVDIHHPGIFKKIEDDAEWADVYRFLMDRGCLTISGLDRELKGGRDGIPGLVIT